MATLEIGSKKDESNTVSRFDVKKYIIYMCSEHGINKSKPAAVGATTAWVKFPPKVFLYGIIKTDQNWLSMVAHTSYKISSSRASEPDTIIDYKNLIHQQ